MARSSGIPEPVRAARASRRVSHLRLAAWAGRDPARTACRSGRPAPPGRVDARVDLALRRIRTNRQLQSVETGWSVRKPACAGGTGTEGRPWARGDVDARRAVS